MFRIWNTCFRSWGRICRLVLVSRTCPPVQTRRLSDYSATLPSRGCSVLTHPSSCLKAQFSNMSSVFIFDRCLLLCKGKFIYHFRSYECTAGIQVWSICSVFYKEVFMCKSCDYLQSLRSGILFLQKIRLFSIIFSFVFIYIDVSS
jgi:hypothetical protein